MRFLGGNTARLEALRKLCEEEEVCNSGKSSGPLPAGRWKFKVNFIWLAKEY